MAIDNEKTNIESLRAFISFLKTSIFVGERAGILKKASIHSLDYSWFDFSNLNESELQIKPTEMFIGLIMEYENDLSFFVIPSSLILKESIETFKFSKLDEDKADKLLAFTTLAPWANEHKLDSLYLISQNYDGDHVEFTIENRCISMDGNYTVQNNKPYTWYNIAVRYMSNAKIQEKMALPLDHIVVNSVIEYQKFVTGLHKRTGNDIFKEMPL